MAVLKDNELACKNAGMIECRADPLRVVWSTADLTSADHHTLNGRFSCSLQIADNPADRRMFAEVFLSTRESVTADVLSAHFVPAIRSALQSIVAKQSAAILTDSTSADKGEWIPAIRNAIDPVAFASGLELLPPFQLEIESPSLQRENLEQMARVRAEARTVGQVQHLQRASELLKQFQEMRRSSPDLPAGKLLEQLSAADRGLALQTLLMAASEPNRSVHTSLWAVSGNALVQMDIQTIPPRMKVIPLPDTLGPLRSVQSASADGALLIGARGGIMLAPMENLSDAQSFTYPDLQSQLGFNAAVQTGNMLWGSHSEVGLVQWNLQSPSTPVATYPEATVVGSSTEVRDQSILVSGSIRSAGSGVRLSGVRNLIAFDDSSIAYSLGNQMIVRTDEARTAISSLSPADITALIPSSRAIYVVHQDGTIGAFDRATREIREVRRRVARLTTACGLPWLGELRLLLASDDGTIDCIGVDDALVTEYLSPYRGFKILSATESHIAAVTPDRQRIVIWSTADWQRPAGEVHITSQTKHRIADIQFVRGRS